MFALKPEIKQVNKKLTKTCKEQKRNYETDAKKSSKIVSIYTHLNMYIQELRKFKIYFNKMLLFFFSKRIWFSWNNVLNAIV